MAQAVSDIDTRPGAQESGPDTTTAELAAIRKDLAALLRSVGIYSQHRSTEAADEIRHLLESLQHGAQNMEKKVEKNMREHPREWFGTAIGLLGIGLALGLIFGRRD